MGILRYTCVRRCTYTMCTVPTRDLVILLARASRLCSRKLHGVNLVPCPSTAWLSTLSAVAACRRQARLYIPYLCVYTVFRLYGVFYKVIRGTRNSRAKVRWPLTLSRWTLSNEHSSASVARFERAGATV